MNHLLYPGNLRSVGTLFLVWAGASSAVCHIVARVAADPSGAPRLEHPADAMLP